MYTKTFLSTAILLGIATAQSSTLEFDDVLPSQAVSRLDILASQYDAAATSLESFLDTQTIIPTDLPGSQADIYLSAAANSVSASLPAFITALPTSLQSPASAILQGEASIFSDPSGMGAGAGAGTTATRSAGPSNSANGTSTPTSAANPPPVSAEENAAGRNGAVMAAGALVVGLAGVMAWL